MLSGNNNTVRDKNIFTMCISNDTPSGFNLTLICYSFNRLRQKIGGGYGANWMNPYNVSGYFSTASLNLTIKPEGYSDDT